VSDEQSSIGRLRGVRLTQPMVVQVPDEPGRYVVEIGVVREHIAWYADYDEDHPARAEVDVFVASAP
jgi:hypothetical protein